MIKIENVDIHGWEAAIRGARAPMSSWSKSDSTFWERSYEDEEHPFGINHYHNILKEHITVEPWDDVAIEGTLDVIGPADHKLLMNLCKGGPEESKWRRFVNVTLDITAPLYWWKEFETYKVGTVSNSCSTMHKIQAKEFTLEDFSCEHIIEIPDDYIEECWIYPFTLAVDGDGEMEEYPLDILKCTIKMLNKARDLFLETKDKKYWWQMIQLLPSSYNQRRTIQLNYEVLAKQYRERKEHKLDEWRDYCEWIKTLPYHEFITGEETSQE